MDRVKAALLFAWRCAVIVAAYVWAKLKAFGSMALKGAPHATFFVAGVLVTLFVTAADRAVTRYVAQSFYSADVNWQSVGVPAALETPKKSPRVKPVKRQKPKNDGVYSIF